MDVGRDTSGREQLRSGRLLSISERGSYIICRTKLIWWANQLHIKRTQHNFYNLQRMGRESTTDLNLVTSAVNQSYISSY